MNPINGYILLTNFHQFFNYHFFCFVYVIVVVVVVARAFTSCTRGPSIKSFGQTRTDFMSFVISFCFFFLINKFFEVEQQLARVRSNSSFQLLVFVLVSI